jgi:hypothetical protein
MISGSAPQRDFDYHPFRRNLFNRGADIEQQVEAWRSLQTFPKMSATFARVEFREEVARPADGLCWNPE